MTMILPREKRSSMLGGASSRSNIAILIIFAAFFVAGPFLNGYYLQIGVYIGVYVSVSQSLSLVWGHLGSMSLTQTAFFGIGAYATALALRNHGLPTAIVLLGSVGVPVLLAVVVGVLGLRKPGHGFVMISLITLFVLEILARDLTELTGGPSGLPGIPPPEISVGGWTVVFSSYRAMYYLAFVVLIAILAGHAWLLSGRTGRAIHAIRDDDQAAGTVGIAVWRLRIIVLCVSSVSAGVAGYVFSTFVSFIGPEIFGPFYLLTVLAIVVAGGLDSMLGILVSGVILTIIPEVFRFDPQHQMLLYGVFVLVVVRLAPNGLPTAAAAVWRRMSYRFRGQQQRTDNSMIGVHGGPDANRIDSGNVSTH